MSNGIKLLLFLIVILYSCSSGKKTVVPVNKEPVLQSGYWNNNDSRTLSEDLIKELLNDTWLKEYMNVHKNLRPILIVGNVTNSGNKTIDSLVFIKDIERSILKYNTARLIQTNNKRNELNTRIAGKSESDCFETLIKWGIEQGADFIINGNVVSTPGIHKKNKFIHYTIQLELINLETRSEVWIGKKSIKKQITE